MCEGKPARTVDAIGLDELYCDGLALDLRELANPAERIGLDALKQALERTGGELFSWLNRWNDAVATQLESEPRAAAERNLAPHGWQVGKHAAGER